jgi:hypothetical protein
MSESDRTALVALRDRREQVFQILSDSFANDLLDVDAFDDRLARAHQAMTVAELDALVADVAPLPPEARHAPLVKLEVGSVPDKPRSVAAVFSNLERHGAWQVPSALKVVSVFGNAELDFREARFASGVTELRVRAVFGNVEITVPPNLSVECEGTAVFASFAHAESAPADPDRPILRIVGTAVFGNVEIHTRLPGESERDARRRSKRERKQLRASQEPLALPPRRE